MQTRLTLYQQLVGILASRSNITIYFTGDQEWLILNPGNYTGDFAVNESVSQALFLHTFCDGHMQIDNNNSAELLTGPFRFNFLLPGQILPNTRICPIRKLYFWGTALSATIRAAFPFPVL